MSSRNQPKYQIGQTVVLRDLQSVKIISIDFKSWDDEEGSGGETVYDLDNGEWCYESDVLRRKLTA